MTPAAHHRPQRPTDTVAPAFDGTLDQDAARLQAHVAHADDQLALLPTPESRDVRQRQNAEEIHESCRALRQKFLLRHADAVYDRLTDTRSRYMRLDELAVAAAKRFPGLVPSRRQMEHERVLRQSQKEGREIDQGIFFRALLQSPVAGPHLLDAMMRPTPRALRLREEFEREGTIEMSTVSIRRRNAAARLTIHNVSCLNAEDEQLVDDLETAVDLALLDNTSSVGVVRGGVMTHPRYTGMRVFSAGINLRELHAGRISLTGFILRRELGCIAKVVHGLLTDPSMAFLHRTVQKPWVAAVDGFAIGGGMQLLFAFDRVLSADDAYFSLPAANEGIVPGLANFRVSRFVGSRAARRLILGGERILATDPDGRLIADEVVSAATLEERIEAAVSDLAAPAVVANRRMLNLAEEPIDRMLAYLAEFAYVQATRLYASDVLAKNSVLTDAQAVAAVHRT